MGLAFLLLSDTKCRFCSRLCLPPTQCHLHWFWVLSIIPNEFIKWTFSSNVHWLNKIRIWCKIVKSPNANKKILNNISKNGYYYNRIGTARSGFSPKLVSSGDSQLMVIFWLLRSSVFSVPRFFFFLLQCSDSWIDLAEPCYEKEQEFFCRWRYKD